MMEALSLTVQGTIYRRGQTGGLLLDQAAPDVILRLAFVTQGTERPIFPALALDDWGRERNSLSLYRWVYEKGTRFPRAEVFGYKRSGRETQIFVRDLEVFFKYPCYAYPDRTTPISDGIRINTIFLANQGRGGDSEEDRGEDTVDWPLRHAAVSWEKGTAAELITAGWQPLAESGPTS